MTNTTLTALPGVRVGHATHLDRLTGCTVVLFDSPATVAFKAYGGGGAYNTGPASGKTNYARHLHRGRQRHRAHGRVSIIASCATGTARLGPDGAVVNPSIPARRSTTWA